MGSSPRSRPSSAGRLPRRVTDRLEDAAAWVVVILGLLTLLAALVVGLRSYADLAGRTPPRLRVDAVLLEDAPQRILTSATPVIRVPARYVDQGGRAHVAEVPVRGRLTAGSTVPVWVDRHGQVAGAPIMRTDPMTAAAGRGLGVAVLGGAVLLAAWTGTRRYINARNSAAWASEWARVEPEWSGRQRST